MEIDDGLISFLKLGEAYAYVSMLGSDEQIIGEMNEELSRFKV